MVREGADYLDRAGADVAVMWKTGGEGRSVVKSERWAALGFLQLGLEGINFVPVFKYSLLHQGEVRLLRHY